MANLNNNDGKMEISNDDDTRLSPFEVDVILRLILEHVGGPDKKDLINCRRVSKAWNSIALPQLKANEFTLKLNYSNIREYKEQLAKTELDDMVMHGQSPGLGLTIDIIGDSNFTQAASGQLNMVKELLNQSDNTTLDSLFQYPHPIQTINYIMRQSRVSEDEVWKLIIASSSSLKNLNFNGYFCRGRYVSLCAFVTHIWQTILPAIFKKEEKVAEIDVNFVFPLFPQLHHVYFDIVSVSRKQDKSFDQLIKLVNSACALETLSLVGFPLEKHYDETYGEETMLLGQVVGKICRFLTGISTAAQLLLTQLEIPLFDVESRDSLYKLEFGRLQGLKLHQLITSYNLQPSFYEFLRLKCPNLTSLEVCYLLFRESMYDVIPILNPKPTPCIFPKITHFGLFDVLGFKNTHGLARMVDNLVFAARSFPNLTSIGLSAIIIPALYIGFKIPIYNAFRPLILTIVFPNVTAVNIEADRHLFGIPDKRQLLNHQRRMLPRLDKIVFLKIRPLDLFFGKPANLLPTYFAARCLEFKYYDMDWLNILLNQNEVALHLRLPLDLFDEIRKCPRVLKIQLQKKYAKWGEPVANETKPEFREWIHNILIVFPNLREFELEDNVFRRVGEPASTRINLYKEFELLKAKFPRIQFKITLL